MKLELNAQKNKSPITMNKRMSIIFLSALHGLHEKFWFLDRTSIKTFHWKLQLWIYRNVEYSLIIFPEIHNWNRSFVAGNNSKRGNLCWKFYNSRLYTIISYSFRGSFNWSRHFLDSNRSIWIPVLNFIAENKDGNAISLPLPKRWNKDV